MLLIFWLRYCSKRSISNSMYVKHSKCDVPRPHSNFFLVLKFPLSSTFLFFNSSKAPNLKNRNMVHVKHISNANGTRLKLVEDYKTDGVCGANYQISNSRIVGATDTIHCKVCAFRLDWNKFVHSDSTLAYPDSVLISCDDSFSRKIAWFLPESSVLFPSIHVHEIRLALTNRGIQCLLLGHKSYISV